MLRTIKHHYSKLQSMHKVLLGIFFLFGMVAMFRGIFANDLPFEDTLPTLFSGMNFDTGNYSTVHFNHGGNNFAGIIFWLTGQQLATGQHLTINGGTQEISCTGMLRGLYYNNMRGRRLWPLDTGSLAILSGQGSGYENLIMSGGLFTNCSDFSGNYPTVDPHDIYGMVHHEWSGVTNLDIIVGAEYTPQNFIDNDIDPSTSFSGTLKMLGGEYTGFLYDSYGHIATISSGLAMICGNGYVEGTEQCDDGNTNDNDGCSVSCTVEAPALCPSFLSYPSTGLVGYPLTFTFSGNRGLGFSISGFSITSPMSFSFSTGWTTTGVTTYSYTPTASGAYMGNVFYFSNYSGAITGSCDRNILVSSGYMCSFTGSTASVNVGDNIDFTCGGDNLTGYILHVWSGTDEVLSGIIYTGANQYTWATGSTLSSGSYHASCISLTLTGATGPQCGLDYNFTVAGTGVTNTGCSPTFVGNVIPLATTFIGGVSYYVNTTGITLNISATDPVTYTITGDFTTTPLTGSYTGSQYSSVISRSIYLSGLNAWNNIHSTFDTGTCSYNEALRRIYVDTLGPSAATPLSPSVGSGVCNAGNLALSRTASVDVGSGIGLSGYQYVLTSASGLVYSGIVTTTGTTLSTLTMALGNYTWYVKSFDALGNSTNGSTGSFVIGASYCSGVALTGVRILAQLASITNADLNKVYSSEIFYIIGLTGSSLLSINSGTLIINGTGIATTGMVNQGDQLRIELVSSDEYDTTVTSLISVAGITGSFSVTTKDNACSLTRSQKLAITRVYGMIKDNYTNSQDLLDDFLATFQSMLEDEVDLTYDCTLSYLLKLINDDLDNTSVDTSKHIAPNCKEYSIGYDNDERGYYSPNMKNKYLFINRETLIRHIDYYNPGDCHINTYGNASWSENRNTDTIHVAPNGKIYHMQAINGGYTSSDFVGTKYFDNLTTMTSYIDSKNPAKDIWDHKVDKNFTPITYLAPNNKEYKIYGTDRGYMSYRLMKVRYFTSLAELESYINKNNPVK